MYVAGREHPNQVPARHFFEQASRTAIELCTSTEVLHEILYRYAGLGQREVARQVYDLFVQLCPLVLPVTHADMDRARDLACRLTQVSVRDAVHAAVMLNNEIEEIATFDTGFDEIAGVKRVALS